MKPRRILVVDDEPEIRSSLCGVLEDEGYCPEAVGSGDGAKAGVAVNVDSPFRFQVLSLFSGIGGLNDPGEAAAQV